MLRRSPGWNVQNSLFHQLPCHLFRAAKLLDASAAEAAWNFCAPVADYDGLRKEVAAVFADKIVEVQSLVAKLQKTQRAAEQALDKYASRRARVEDACHAPVVWQVRENLRSLMFRSVTVKGPSAQETEANRSTL